MQVGQRVTVRYRIGGTGPSGGPAMSDVVGEITEITDSSVFLRNRKGEIREVARSEIVKIHLIPPAGP